MIDVRFNEAFQPLGDRVLVRRIEDAPVSTLIVIPQVAQRDSLRGVVVSIGPGKRQEDGFRRPLAVKPGDVVRFGVLTDLDAGEFVLIQEADIRWVETEVCSPHKQAKDGFYCELCGAPYEVNVLGAVSELRRAPEASAPIYFEH